MHCNYGICLLSVVACFSGCGAPGEIPGGTAGSVRADGHPLPDVLVTVYPDKPAGGEALGMGITDAKGRFELRTSQPVAPLTLDPGGYRFTIESLGEIPLLWPRKYSDPATTPLMQSVTSSDDELTIDVPFPRILGRFH